MIDALPRRVVLVVAIAVPSSAAMGDAAEVRGIYCAAFTPFKPSTIETKS